MHLLGHGGGWGYSAHSVEAIRFSADTDILLGGLGLFGGRGEYTAKIKVSSSFALLPFVFEDKYFDLVYYFIEGTFVCAYFLVAVLMIRCRGILM